MDPRSHLQATGYDARGRKQYRYHPDWAAWRSERKFDDLISFGEALPSIRRRIARDLAEHADESYFLLSALISLLDVTYMRVGNRTYAEENRTYGATTLQKRHLTFEPDGIRLSFLAKGANAFAANCATRGFRRSSRKSPTCPVATSSPGATRKAICTASIPAGSMPI